MNRNLKYSIIYAALFCVLSWLSFFWFKIYLIMKSGMAKSVSGVDYWSVLPLDHLVYFVLGQLVAYFLLVLIGWLVLFGGNETFLKKMKYPSLGMHFILLSLVISVILLDKFLYPVTRNLIEMEFNFNNFSIIEYVLLIPVLTTLFCFIAGIIKLRIIPRMLFVGIVSVFLLDWAVTGFTKDGNVIKENFVNRDNKFPNLIIIGVDSYDYSKIKNIEEREGFIGSFVNNSVFFEDTLTPLARTYVAWMSILTAYYPVNSGVRYNLFPRDYGKQSSTLMPHLKTLGYHTIYATDERRFANLDVYHGFEKVIGPPAGAADFLLGGASDMPVTNIFMTTTLGRRFFPYSYANRAVAYSYEYQDFLDLYSTELDSVQKNNPVFLATHLCLAHWPYYDRHSGVTETQKPFDIYNQKIQDVNIMAEDIFNKIKNAGLLKNAVVVLLSDHGEGWPERSPNAQKPATYGHGNNLLDEDQQRVMFAVQHFVDGKPMLSPKQINYPASLIDVLPTMMGVASISMPEIRDGYDLSNFIRNNAAALPQERPRLLETEIHVSAIDSVNDGKIDETAVAAETASNYRITNDGRFELLHEAVENFLHYKERAIEFNGEYLHWNSYTGFKVYDSKTYEIRPYDENQLNDGILKRHFCDLFGSDIKKGFLGNVECDVSLANK